MLFVRPIPLGLTAEFMIRQLVDFEQDKVFGGWCATRLVAALEVPFITADSISYIGTTGDVLRAEKVTLYPSSEALWVDGVLALSIWTLVG